MKGHVCIELKNEKTGKIKRYDGDNMVTNAISEFVKCCNVMSGSSEAQVQNLTPIATKLLGGLYLFS